MMKIRKGFVTALLMSIACGCFTACSDDDDVQTGVCKVSGRVIDQNDDPVSDARISILTVEYTSRPAETKTNADGEFDVTVKKATRDLILQVEKDGYQPGGTVLHNIPFEGGEPGESLGSASVITEDIVIYKETAGK